ncbi:MAG: hypothetical protein IPG02_20615 [Ignavibacteria bacterium]|nr:hypothetical protein [Ignavibacteria bacterium]
MDSSSCWVGTVAGSIYRTTNGGFNWTLQFSVSGSFSTGIKMFDANYGIYYGDPTAAGQPYQLRYTTNGGTNWTLSPGAPIAGNEFGVANASGLDRYCQDLDRLGKHNCKCNNCQYL